MRVAIYDVVEIGANGVEGPDCEAIGLRTRHLGSVTASTSISSRSEVAASSSAHTLDVVVSVGDQLCNRGWSGNRLHIPDLQVTV